MDKWILLIITLIVPVVSPELRKMLTEWITQLEIQAKKTANKWDDVLVAMLKSVLLGKED